MIKSNLNSISPQTIQNLIKCEKSEVRDAGKQNTRDDEEISLGYLFAKGLIGTKKQLKGGKIQIYTFLTFEGNFLLEKNGLISI